MCAIQQQTKTERLETRLTPEQKATLTRAAALEGQSLSDYVATHLQAAARETIRKHESITLDAQASAAFVVALLQPASPNAALRAASRRHADLLGD